MRRRTSLVSLKSVFAAGAGHADRLGHNVAVRRMLVGLASAVIAVCLAAIGTDFGLAIYAEYRLSRTVRS